MRPETPARDISRKVADETIDISYEGYSLFFDGFPIHVFPHNKERALKIIEDFLASLENTSKEGNDLVKSKTKKSENDHFRKFCFASIFSLLFPVVMHLFAIYHLYYGFKKKEMLRIGFMIISLALYGLSGYLQFMYFWKKFGDFLWGI